MSTDPTSNRSSAFTPEQLAQVTEMSSKLVRETITEIFKSLTPALHDMAVTPEKLREANRPWEDPIMAARKAREMKLWKQDEEQRLKDERRAKDQCLHEDERGQSTIKLMRNFPDRQARGICMRCHDLIHPKEWRIGAPDEKNPRGVPYLAAPHKDYLVVVKLLSHS